MTLPPGRAARGIFAAALVVAGVTFAAVAVGAGTEVATVRVTADRRLAPVGDLAIVYDVGEIDAAVVNASVRIASAAGGTATLGRTGSLGMRAIVRNGVVVHAPPVGYLIPTTYVALPSAPLGRVLGTDVPRLLGPDRVVMNEMTAGITRALVGDTIVLQAADGSAVPLVIAGIVPHAQIGGSELAFDTRVAGRLGATYDTRVVLHDFDRGRLEQALAAEGLERRRDTNVARSWDPPDPDSTLGTAGTKALLGEPWYRFEADGSISMHPTWIATNLRPARELLDPTIPIVARCHVEVVDGVRAALGEVAAAGLGWAIDVDNANTFGGCYAGARFNRLAQSQIGFLSRHSYGMALDVNTVTNCQGCVPTMHCEVVRIFRRHGFAWGGNFTRPDGMHFEWVGERRDLIPYDSDHCPNLVNGTTQSVGSDTLGREVLIAGLEDAAHDH